MEAVPDRLGDGGRRYTAPDAARMLGLTPAAVVRWVHKGLLAGDAPGSATNPTRAWMVDADAIDRRREQQAERIGQSTGRPAQDEQQLLEMERGLYQGVRMSHLEEENERLRAEVDRLRLQVAVLGRTVAELTGGVTTPPERLMRPA